MWCFFAESDQESGHTHLKASEYSYLICFKNESKEKYNN